MTAKQDYALQHLAVQSILISQVANRLLNSVELVQDDEVPSQIRAKRLQSVREAVVALKNCLQTVEKEDAKLGNISFP